MTILEWDHVKDIVPSEWKWKNFTPKELACRHCLKLVIEGDLLNKLEAMRELMGIPLVITSGYRCPIHNAKVRGAPLSMHVRGKAVDIYLNGKPIEDYIKAARKVGFMGIGKAKTFIHVDTGRYREWVY